MLTKEQIEIFRSPVDYAEWFGEILSGINASQNNQENALLHRGFYKKFYEEIFPLACLLSLKSVEWHGARFRNIMGSQQYDVEIENLDLRHIEIATTSFDDAERFRMLEFLMHGHVDGIGAIERDDNGSPISMRDRDEVHLHSETITAMLKKIEIAIIKKSKKIYPLNTGLVIYFDDSLFLFSDEDRAAFKELLNQLRDTWEPVFNRLFLIGPKLCLHIDLLKQ